jgi:hypothetical protein
MKTKLKKDLRFLKGIIGRTITSLFFSFLKAILIYPDYDAVFSSNKTEESVIMNSFVWFFIFFIAIYFFTTWLYSEEKTENK